MRACASAGCKAASRSAAIGPALDLTFPVTTLGAGPARRSPIAAARIRSKTPKQPMLILGQGALRRPDGAAILASARALAESAGMVRDGWNGFNVLHTAAARVGGLDLGFVPGQGGRDVAGILAGCGEGRDRRGLSARRRRDRHAPPRLGLRRSIRAITAMRGAARADVVLPGAAYTEKDATYVNTEGRVQLARRAVFPPGEAREDWTILRALSAALGKPLPYDSLAALRRRLCRGIRPSPKSTKRRKRPGAASAKPARSMTRLSSIRSRDFYRTDPISRASPTMAECAAARAEAGVQKTGTHG